MSIRKKENINFEKRSHNYFHLLSYIERQNSNGWSDYKEKKKRNINEKEDRGMIGEYNKITWSRIKTCG